MTNMYICKHMKYRMIKSSQLMYLSLIYIFIEIFEFFSHSCFDICIIFNSCHFYNRYSNRYSNVFLAPN